MYKKTDRSGHEQSIGPPATPLRGRLLTFVLTPFLLALPFSTPATASEDSANANVEAAGERAHFGQEFCAITSEQTAQYKAQLRARLTEATNFDLHWERGWDKGAEDAIQMRSLRAGAPADFAVRVKTNCERIKWQARNSLLPRPSK